VISNLFLTEALSMALYSVESSDPPELVHAMSGLPISVAQTMCSLELTCARAAVLSEVRIAAIAHYVNCAGNRCEPRQTPVDIVVAPSGNCTVHKDSSLGTSLWSGSSQVCDGDGFLITFLIPEPGSCMLGSCHVEVRDITLKLSAVATTITSQLAALFNNVAMLPEGDAVLVRFAEPKAASIYVSKFVLQLRSPVFRAQFSSSSREVRSQELSFPDFPQAAVRSFLEMLHSDRYTGGGLEAGDVVALFALGDKYGVHAVQEHVMNELSALSLTPKELRSALDAASCYKAVALRTMLVKRLRWLPEAELCAFFEATEAGLSLSEMLHTGSDWIVQCCRP